MNHNQYTGNLSLSYFNKFQEAQLNLSILIKEERLKKRIEKSRKKLG